MIIETMEAKSFVRKGAVDAWWWAEASMNPYQGCYHDCTYCDGKAESYHMHADFGTRIKGKSNAPQLLEMFFQQQGYFPVNRNSPTNTLVDFFPDTKALMTRRQPGKFICSLGGGVCDIYQPAERKLRITQQLLQIVYDYQFPIFLLTKSKLILRDLALLQQINEAAYVNVGVSITVTDEEHQRIIEPKASTTAERFDIIRQLRNVGIHAGVLFMPVMPWISDTDENMDNLFYQAKQAGAEYVLVGGLTLKPGRNKDEFFAMLKQYFPTLFLKYQTLYGNEDKWGNPDNVQATTLKLTHATLKAREYSQKYNIPLRMARYLPEGRIHTNLEIATKLFRLAYEKRHHPPIWHNTYDLIKAAKYIDTYPVDLQELSSQQLTVLPLSKRALELVQEILITGKSNELSKLGITHKMLFFN